MLFDDLPRLIEDSIFLLREHEPPEGYYGSFSGGKDSIVIKQLALEASVKATWWYNKTTLDPPELVQYIKRHHPDVNFVRPKNGNFFRRMEDKGFPLRQRRWCCSEYKESRNLPTDVVIVGIRTEESKSRAQNWTLVKQHHITKATMVSPILQWASDEVWEFIRSRELPYCSLYDEGFHRLGCVGCPMTNPKNRVREFERWPRIEKLWKRAFQRIWEKKSGRPMKNGKTWFGDVHFDTWEQMWEWWLYNKELPGPPDERQIELF